jgi:hypothetical protein
MWSGQTIYGYRQGLVNEIYYFLCIYGEDCSRTQNLNDVELAALLKKMGLPEFDMYKAKHQEELMRDEWKRVKAEQKN